VQRFNASVVLSPSDLTSMVACDHLLQLKLAVMRGEIKRPRRDDPHLDLIRRHGEEHEHSFLDGLEEPALRIELPEQATPVDLRQAEADTLAAMKRGERTIFQATFFDGRWRGHADFLRRVETPSPVLGDWSYEVLDTKLAKAAKPSHVQQLCSYSVALERLQGVLPMHAWLRLGDGTEQPFELAELMAVHRRAIARLEAVVGADPVPTYPEPISHCQVCEWSWECEKRREADDHLSLVAGIRRDQRSKLEAIEIPTLTVLADIAEDHASGDLSEDVFDLLHHQARLQALTTRTGDLQRRFLEAERARGFARLPAPDDADVFWDLEGDPFLEQGVEYLWGWQELGADGDWRYKHVWAHSMADERRAFEQFVDMVTARRAANPGMHVYHYAPHEAATLKRLAGRHGTRGSEVDQLLREGVLCDLYAVIRQGMQVGQRSYSLKQMEPFYDFERHEKTVRNGGGSIVAYERWIMERDDSLLDAIREYNAEDCASTRHLRDWLLERRADAAGELGADFAELAKPEPEEKPKDPEWLPDVIALQERLEAELPEDPAADTDDQGERRLLASLLLYHRRESLPEWWRFFSLCDLTSVELIGEVDAIGELELEHATPPEKVARSLAYRMTFPLQEQRLSLGDVIDPATGEKTGVLTEVDPAGSLMLKRSEKFQKLPPPRAIIGSEPIRYAVKREALCEQARELLGESHGAHPAVRAVLRRERPRTQIVPGSFAVADCVAAARGLDDSYLVVQGPPGTGKTFRAARMIVALIGDGRRVGVSAVSHKAIHNLLRAVEEVADAHRVEVRGFHKSSDRDPASEYESTHGLIDSGDSNAKAENPELNLVSGTSWLFARATLNQELDVLFIDEAGQMALADVVCAGRAARSVVLLGDPQQLPQVTKGTHPDGAEASVLEHLLDGAPVIEPDRGIFIGQSWRMHPDICAFISELSYAGQLSPAHGCGLRRVDAPSELAGAGLRWLPVDHTGNSQASPEEAEVVARACAALLNGGTVTDSEGREQALTPADILVVTPYNLAVACLLAAVPDGVRVGTVDKFQGQEAPVVFYAMASSSGDDAPRGLDFLFSRNRLNVAISRAQALAVLVCAPVLLDARCAKAEQLPLVNGLCMFAEFA